MKILTLKGGSVFLVLTIFLVACTFLNFTFLSKNKQMRDYKVCSGVFTPCLIFIMVNFS